MSQAPQQLHTKDLRHSLCRRDFFYSNFYYTLPEETFLELASAVTLLYICKYYD